MAKLEPVLPDNRVAFVGRTGSGKTYLARALLNDVDRLIVLDAKGTITGPEWRVEDFDGASRALRNPDSEFRLRVPAPINGDWEPFLWAAYEAENCTVYIDEVYGVETGTKPSNALRACITRGRELGIGVWAATQRPSQIPLIILSEADWIFTFQLRLDVDRKRMAELIGPAALDPLSGHNVVVYNDKLEKPVRYRSIVVRESAKPTVSGAETAIPEKGTANV